MDIRLLLLPLFPSTSCLRPLRAFRSSPVLWAQAMVSPLVFAATFTNCAALAVGNVTVRGPLGVFRGGGEAVNLTYKGDSHMHGQVTLKA